jgi:geranylgeranyl pyrophosphate synthase
MTSIKSEIFDSYRLSFEREFTGWVNSRYGTNENSLFPVMKYVLEGQGKRVRPLMAILSADAFGQWRKAILPSIAVEMVHIYSLVHDDLPCMDDDDMRRGRPTAHVQYDEASALLAGDAILADSFALLTCPEQFADPDAEFSVQQRLDMTSELAKSSGSRGMCLGQSLDLHWTARDGASKLILDELHLHKTGELLGASCALGAIAGGADRRLVQKFRSFGRSIGWSFQILDDVLDVLPTTGKTPGKDIAAKKLTYLKFMSADEAVKVAREITQKAIEELNQTNLETEKLIRFAMILLDREK